MPLRSILTILLSAVLMSALGCASPRTPATPVTNANVNLFLDQSHARIKAGEIVTFTANATGVAGREEDIRWSSNGGDLTVLDRERYARVQYYQPGLYSVEAQLFVDGELVDVKNAFVTVEPLA